MEDMESRLAKLEQEVTHWREQAIVAAKQYQILCGFMMALDDAVIALVAHSPKTDGFPERVQRFLANSEALAVCSSNSEELVDAFRERQGHILAVLEESANLPIDA